MCDNSKEHRCTGHCCKHFFIPFTYQELQDMLDDTKDIRRCKDYEIIARMVIPTEVPDHLKGQEDADPEHCFTCRHLRENNDCAIYEQRPRMCREYPYGRQCRYPGCTYTGLGTTREEEEENTNVSNRPHYCPEQIKVFGKTFLFSYCSDAIEKQKPGILSNPPKSPPTRQIVSYEINNCTLNVRVEQVHTRLNTRENPPRGQWIATLQDDYTHITGPRGDTVESAVSFLELELSLVRDLLEACK